MDRKTRQKLVDRLNRDGRVLAERFELEYRAIEADRANATSRYGICYSDGTIRIRLRHATTGRPLKYSSLINTLCHELAHLRHFNHGPRFKALYLQILDFARRVQIYRPGPARAAAPRRGPAPPPRVYEPTAPPRAAPAAPEPERPRGMVQLDLFG